MIYYFERCVFVYAAVISFMLTGCASVGVLTGGPKDQIPPRLIYSFPKDQSTEFRAQHLEFRFDEPIKIRNLKKNLVITPNENRDFRFKAVKNILTLDFETPLSEKTTYILDFGGSVSDLTENNKITNFKIAFSTGKYIDSLYVSGHVKDAKTRQPAAHYRVGLYDVSDTTRVQAHKPKYFAVTDTAGDFKITNIRAAKYHLYALKEDKKQDFIYNASIEHIAFEPQQIELTDVSKVGYELYATQYDIDSFFVKSARTKRHYFEVITNKTISEFDVRFENQKYDSVFYYQKESKTLRFFNKNLDKSDSVRTFITLIDSSKNTIHDTVFVKFNKKRSKTKHPFSFTVKPSHNSTFQKADSFQLELDFSVPIAHTFSDSLVFWLGKDTLGDHIDNKKFIWNTPRTKLKINHWFRMDSSQIKVQLRDKMFASFESDSSTTQNLKYGVKKPENFGEITGEVRSDYTNYIFELIDEKGNVEKTLFNPKAFKLDFVKTGKKKVRILIDENKNGMWDNGNLHDRTPPEKVYIFDIKQAVKVGWTVEDIFIEIKKE